MPINDSNNTSDRDNAYVEIVGGSLPYNVADVTLEDGVKKLETRASITVQELLGEDQFADNWFRIENTGATNDTITVTIAATSNDPSTPDRDRPQYQKVFTIVAGEVGDEIELRDRIISELNADSNFSDYFLADRVKDNAIVHIASKHRGEFWESSSFTVVPTGTASVTVGYSDFILRGKVTSLTSDPDDRRIGVLGISGAISVNPGLLGNLIQVDALNGSSNDLTVDGSSTPVTFTIYADADYDQYFQVGLFHGVANGVKFGQFLNINLALANGILLQAKSDDVEIQDSIIKSTDDFKARWSSVRGFELNVQAGGDHFNAAWDLGLTPFVIRKQGTFGAGNDDYVTVTIRDDLTAVTSLIFTCKGFQK